MKTNHFDVCVIGSGAGAAPIIYELSLAGLKVVVLEKGPWFKTEHFVKDEMVASRRNVYSSNPMDEPHVIEFLNQKNEWVAESNRVDGLNLWNGNCVGGSSNFMSGYFHRLKPRDFELLKTYGEISGANINDWPISYYDLEPYYEKVERMIGVSGQVVKHKTLEPRSTDNFPFPPLMTNKISKLLDDSSQVLGMQSIPLPRAILSKPHNGRKSCYYSNYCGSYGCSSDAKGSSRAALINLALVSGNLEIRPNSKVFKIETNAKGLAVSASFHSSTSVEEKVFANLFIVAAQAIESSRLLLLSKNADFPNGLANNSGNVGKNLLFSGGGVGSGVLYSDNFDIETFTELMKPGLFVNRSIHDFYEISDFEFGPVSKGGIIDFLWEHSNPIRRAIKQKWDAEGNLVYGSELKRKILESFTKSRKLTFEVFNDWLPNDNCYVELDKSEKDKYGDLVAKVRIQHHNQDIKVGKYLANKAIKVLEQLGAKELKMSVNGNPPANLQAGGCRFGNDPQSSVLNSNCRTHEIDNLYVTDGSFMPTGGSVPYTWTIYANSFRIADHLLNKFS